MAAVRAPWSFDAAHYDAHPLPDPCVNITENPCKEDLEFWVLGFGLRSAARNYVSVGCARPYHVATRPNADTPTRRHARYADTPIRRYADTPIRRYADTPIRPLSRRATPDARERVPCYTRGQTPIGRRADGYCVVKIGTSWAFTMGRGFHLPVRASDFGAYRRMVRLKGPLGAGSQLASFSAPGLSC